MGKLRNVVLIILLFLSQFTSKPALASSQLIMGVFPRHSATETINMFEPMAKHLSRKLDREVRLVASKDFSSFWEDVLNEKFDIVHFNQYHYIKSHSLRGYDVILKNEERGASKIASIIVVKKGSTISSLSDLKGKQVMFGGDQSAMMSYVVPTLLLRNNGFSAGDYKEVFSRNPVNALMSMYFDSADAAGIGDAVLDLPRVKKNTDRKDLRIIARSMELAHLPWAVNRGMKKEQKIKIQDILNRLEDSEEGINILKKAGLTNLRKASDKEYNPHREIVFKVLGEKY